MSVLRCHKGACLLGSPVLKEVAAELSSILELQFPAVVSVACLSLSRVSYWYPRELLHQCQEQPLRQLFVEVIN